MLIDIKDKYAKVSGTPKEVMLFGIAFLEDLHPDGVLAVKDEFVVYVDKWAKGEGTFDVSMHDTKAAFLAAVRSAL